MKNNRMTFIKLLLRSKTNQNNIESRVKKKKGSYYLLVDTETLHRCS